MDWSGNSDGFEFVVGCEESEWTVDEECTEGRRYKLEKG